MVDLSIQYNSIKPEIDKAISNVISDCAFIGGRENKYVKEFEHSFSEYLKNSYCVGCANGTDAIEIVLKALGIGFGDEVIVPALSWISTSEAGTSAGAKPAFVDILSDFFTIDPEKIEKKITSDTKAIIIVH
jgi:dTDP-4-amino-4,6-dideoxygalactose transaminase